MQGRHKYKSFFKVEPLCHGNITLPPTHSPSYWFDPLKKPLLFASFHREDTHKKVGLLVVVPLRSAPSPSGSYFFRQFFPLVKKWCFAQWLGGFIPPSPFSGPTTKKTFFVSSLMFQGLIDLLGAVYIRSLQDKVINKTKQ